MCKPGCWYSRCKWRRDGLSSLWSLLFKPFNFFNFLPGATLSSSLCLASRILSFLHLLSVENKPLSPEQAGRGARWWVRTRGVTWFCGDGVGGGSGGNCLLTSLSRLGSSLHTHRSPQWPCRLNSCASQQHWFTLQLCGNAAPCACRDAWTEVRARAGMHGPRSVPLLGCTDWGPCVCLDVWTEVRARAGMYGPRSVSAQGPYMCQDLCLLLPPLKSSLSLRVMSFKFCHCDFSWVLGGKGNEYLQSICHD